jgi:2-keto-4-pentenoate hydratase
VTLTDVIQASAFAMAALEIVDSRISAWDITIADTIADNGSAGMYVVGAVPHAVLNADMANCAMVMHRNGERVSEGKGSACMGHPLNAAVWLARKLQALGTPLLAGDVILTGALGPMVDARPGDMFEATVGGFGHVRVEFGH